MIGWGTPHQIALYVGRPVRTIRTWMQRGKVDVACDLETKQQVVNAASARRHAESRDNR